MGVADGEVDVRTEVGTGVTESSYPGSMYVAKPITLVDGMVVYLLNTFFYEKPIIISRCISNVRVIPKPRTLFT